MQNELNKTALFGFLTNLVDDELKQDNFFKALKFRKNFSLMHDFLNVLTLKIDYELDIKECFDCESDNYYSRLFRRLVIKEESGLYEIIMSNYNKYLTEIKRIKIEKVNYLDIRLKSYNEYYEISEEEIEE